MRDKQGAIANFHQALQIAPQSADAYYNQGIVLAALGDKQAVLADLQKAADLYQQIHWITRFQASLDKIKKLQ